MSHVRGSGVFGGCACTDGKSTTPKTPDPGLRRTVEQGGAYINNKPRTDVNTKLTAADLASETVMVVRSGKKKYGLLRFE